jgi:hypothetical protein
MKRAYLAVLPVVLALLACESGPSGDASGPEGKAAGEKASSAARKPTPAPIVIEEGTPLILALQTTLSTATAQAGDTVVATLVEPIRQGERVVVPEGAEVRGKVVTAVRPGKTKGLARLVIEFDHLEAKGRSHEIAASAIDVTGDTSKKRDAAIIGGGAGVGAIIGGIADGGKGAAIGALIGGAAGGGTVLATRGKDLVLDSGQKLRITLGRSLRL